MNLIGDEHNGWSEHAKAGGATYCLRHLNPRVLQVGSQFNVLITVGCHAFTRDALTTDDPADLIRDGSKDRCFCPQRYQWSLDLPAIVNNASLGSVFFSQGKTMLCVDYPLARQAPYAIFFEMWAAQSGSLDAVMSIRSAYEKPNLPQRLPAISFRSLTGAIVAGRSVRAPPQTRSIRTK